MFDSVDPYKSSSPADKIPPIQPHHEKDSGPSSSSSENNFAQKYWHFDAAEAKKFLSTLCNTITNEIKHLDEKVKETSEELKRSEEGEDE